MQQEVQSPIQITTFLCGSPYCTAGEVTTELSFNECFGDNSVCENNLVTAKVVMRRLFNELEEQSLEEQGQYQRAKLQPPFQKGNQWAAYTNKDRLREFMSSSLDFIRNHAESRMRLLSETHLRFLIMLQHLVSEDTNDFHKPEGERKHLDAFEGFLTDGVNSQLVKDAHRSEWSVEGHAFSIQSQFSEGCHETTEDRKKAISTFQVEFVTTLEDYLLDFCRRREMSTLGTKRLLQSVTTQMSQCGLANLDRSSQAARYFVSGQGLDQQTAYNLSTMDSGSLGEALKLSMFCMKTGFTQYHTEETLMPSNGNFSSFEFAPRRCEPSSFLYQYATVMFVPGSHNGACERINCVILDALDEVRINSIVVC